MLALWLTATGETCYFRCGRESIATKVRAHSSEVKRSHSCTIWPTEPQNIHPQHLRSFCRGPSLSAVFIFYLHPCLCCITLHFTVMTCPSGLLLLSKCFVLKKDFHPFLMKIILWDEQLAVPLWPDVVPSVPVVVYLGLCGQNCRHLSLTNVVESLHKYVPPGEHIKMYQEKHTHTHRKISCPFYHMKEPCQRLFAVTYASPFQPNENNSSHSSTTHRSSLNINSLLYVIRSHKCKVSD